MAGCPKESGVSVKTEVRSSWSSFLGISLQELVTVGVELFALPLLAAVTLVLYVDLRVRKEGFDLQLLAERMGLPPDSDLPPEALAPAPPPTTPGGGHWPPVPARPPGQEPAYWPPPPTWWQEQQGLQPADDPRPDRDDA